MDDILALQKAQASQHLLRKTADQTDREALEIVGLDELVQIHAQKFSGYAQVTSEIEALGESEHIVLSIRVLLKLVVIT